MHLINQMLGIRTFLLPAALCLAGGLLTAQAQTKAHKPPFAALDQFSEDVRRLAARVSPSVVEISVLRYAPREEEGGQTGVVLSRQQVVGSGVIVDSDGYIVTNAHVVANALRIRVTRSMQAAAVGDALDQNIDNALAQSLSTPVDATLVGVFKELDVALIKVPLTGLPALPFADYSKLRQGQVVFAFGSRHGLGDSMSMGVVSSVARQPDSDNPFVYIQTDAPINPGDSGGPLVNTAGEVVGIDTFILTEGGGSEGIGFAIPSTLVQIVCGELRDHGHMHRQLIGVVTQAITPVLAAALGLPRQSGVMVCDVKPGGPAEKAGVKLGDIVLSVDGRRSDNLPVFMTSLLLHPPGRIVKLELLRGDGTVPLDVTPTEESHDSDRLVDLINPDKNLVRRLGIVGLTVDKDTQKIVDDLRGPYGVIVAALSASSSATPNGLQVGDVIHEINGTVVSSVDDLRTKMDQLKRGDAVALYIERASQLQYLAFEVE